MARVVQKFGGTSLADITLIRNAARRVVAEVKAGNEVAVVVSAMAGTTNQLVAWADEIAGQSNSAEYDGIVSSGEQVSSGLFALAVESLGVPARSWAGWQVPVLTDANHGRARIQKIDAAGIMRDLKAGGGSCWFSGHRAGSPRDDLWPWRIGHNGCGAGIRFECGSLRYLYRC